MITCTECKALVVPGDDHDCDIFTPAFFFGLVAVGAVIVGRIALGWIAG